MGKRVPDNLPAEFSRFVEVNMGLSFPKEKWGELEKGLHSMCGQFGGGANEEIFARHVMSTPLSKRRIEMLAGGLTVGETYFFREKNAFDAFGHIVLAKAAGMRGSADRNLRIWSAGCASGEEPYTIAMMLKMLLPDLKDWNITLLATDINPHFLEKAAKGVYARWSFRDVPELIINRFFTKRGSGLEILPEIKKMVTFSYHNLMKDDYSSLLNNTNAMDVIFCRNVLMYFSPETIKSVTRNFHRCLTDNGRLIVSQTELNDEYFQEFGKASHAGAMFFIKSDVGAEKKKYRLPSPAAMRETGLTKAVISNASCRHSGLDPQSWDFSKKPQDSCFRRNDDQCGLTPAGLRIDQPSPLAGAGKDEEEIRNGVAAAVLYEKAGKFFEQGEYNRAEDILGRLIEGNPGNAEALSLMARICANQGRLDDALRYIEEATKADNMNPGRHYLHSAILKEKGLKQEAMEALKKAVYLDADFALAYFAMGNLALGSGNRLEAERQFNNALLLLRKHGYDDILPESEGMTAGRLMDLIESMQWRKKERG